MKHKKNNRRDDKKKKKKRAMINTKTKFSSMTINDLRIKFTINRRQGRERETILQDQTEIILLTEI